MATNNDFLPAGPASCAVQDLLTVGDLCLNDLDIEESEIVDIFFSEPSLADPTVPMNPIALWVDAGLAADDTTNEAAILTWYGLISPTVADKVRQLEVVGDKPDPETNLVTLSKKTQKKVGMDKHVINIDTYKKSNLNYAFMQKMQRGWKGFIWFATESHLYGGINGINAITLKSSAPLERGTNAGALKFSLQWLAHGEPPRDRKPF